VTPSADPVERATALERRILGYVERYDAARDERAIFAFVYSLVLGNLAKVLAADGQRFDDRAWVATLAERFAERFFAAMDAIDHALGAAPRDREPTPEELYAAAPRPWAAVYLTIRNGGAYVYESFLFSMMAHLSHDLPLALVAAKLERDGGGSHVRDFHRMNVVLADETEALETALARRYNPLLPIFDRLAGRYGIFFSNYGIRMTRSIAWYNADRLLDPLSAADAQASIDRSTDAFVDFVRRPKERWLRVLLAISRFLLPRHHRWPKRRAGSSSAPARTTR
jgi:hypothetical protein